jgi:sulfate adenylyltransferase subunit 1
MITGASGSSLIIVLIDARQGVVEQTRRHSIIASLLNIPHVVVAINKMDLVDFSENVFNNIVIDYSAVANQLGLTNITFFPISALDGDNIVDVSAKMTWYEGPTLLQFLEEVPLETDINLTDPRFQVQYVIRPQTGELHDYRGYAGKVSSGIYRKGDEVVVLPAGKKTTISKLEIAGEEVDVIYAPQSAVIHLEDDIDVSRGDSIVQSANLPQTGTELDVLLCWMDEKPLIPGNKYYLQHQSKGVRAVIRDVAYKLDVNTLMQEIPQGPVTLNEVVKATIKTASPLSFDQFAKLRQNGSAILVDETSNSTVAAVLFQ